MIHKQDILDFGLFDKESVKSTNLIGCSVISQANSGVLQTLKNSFSARSSLNSGK